MYIKQSTITTAMILFGPKPEIEAFDLALKQH